jgi:curli biogenesis system outer membrane secretion channel CsgG
VGKFERPWPLLVPWERLRAVLAGLLLVSCATVDEPETVQLDAAPPAPSPTSKAAMEARGLKRKVIIARFTNETTYGKSVLLDGTADLIARQASDVLATRLAEAGQFLLFERDNATPIIEALDAGKTDELGLPADFVIIGSVSEFGRKTTSDTGVFSRTKKQTTEAKVNVRLVDVRTSRVLFAQEGAGSAESEVGTVVGIGTRADYDSTLNDKAISAAISKVVSNLVENLLDQPWRSWVLDVEDGNVLIGGGKSQGIRKGEKLRLVKRGKTVKNPQTSAVIELPGETVATLEVVDVLGATPEEEFSRCTIVDGDLPTEDLTAYVIEELKT